jgi:hypothetical protein
VKTEKAQSLGTNEQFACECILSWFLVRFQKLGFGEQYWDDIKLNRIKFVGTLYASSSRDKNTTVLIALRHIYDFLTVERPSPLFSVFISRTYGTVNYVGRTMATSRPKSIPETSLNSRNDPFMQLSSQDSLEWRKKPIKTTKKPLSKGIPPKAFHCGTQENRRRPRPGEAQKLKMHAETQTKVLNEQKKRLGQNLSIQRSAFKEVTSLRTWPLQAKALSDLEQLVRGYIHTKGGHSDGHRQKKDDEDNNHREAFLPPDPSQPSAGDCSSTLTSSASAPSGEREHKLAMRNPRLSPEKSRLKTQYQMSFLAEQELQPPLPAAYQFGSPLWSMEPRIFSTEKSNTGKRKYVVGQLGRFMDLYWRKADPNQRHYYELIRENTPCRLYFDLEFSRICNPGISEADAETLLDEFYSELVADLETAYKITEMRRTNIVDLDSSTETKFSRHWIVHLPNEWLFANTYAVGQFVKNLVGRLAELQATGQLGLTRPMLQKLLFVAGNVRTASDSAPEKKTCFIDLGVYTRNRLFRLLGSSKFGKPASAALRISESNEFRFPKDFGNHNFYLPAMRAHLRKEENDSINIEDSDSKFETALKEFVAATDWSMHAEVLAQTLVVPANQSKLQHLVLPFIDESKEELISRVPGQTRRLLAMEAKPICVGPSPYPVLDDYVQRELATRGGVKGAIRAWSVEMDPEQDCALRITYQMSRNRWCECVRREHKSNNIFWSVDFASYQAVQGCHDPECRLMNFRGSPISLPDEVTEAVRDTLLEEALCKFDEKSLLHQSKTKIEEEKRISATALLCDESFECALGALNLDDILAPLSVGSISQSSDMVATVDVETSACKITQPVHSKFEQVGGVEDDSGWSSDCEDVVAIARKLEEKRKESTDLK